MNKKIVLSISGGLDSTTLLHYLWHSGYEIYPVSFNYGQKHSIELEMARFQVEYLKNHLHIPIIHDLKEIDISFMKDLLEGSSALTDDKIEVPTLAEVIGQPQPITYVPFRNMMFLTILLSYAEAVGAPEVCYGAQKHDEYSGYWDTSLYFVDAMNKVADLNRQHKIEVIAPFVNLSKAEEIVIGKKLGIDYGKTWTSYKVIDEANLIADFDNPTSRDRVKAFAEVGVEDPIKYNVDINWTELFAKYKKDFNYEEVIKKILENENQI
jgi:7-cyano-7-deazaguanine synthase